MQREDIERLKAVEINTANTAENVAALQTGIDAINEKLEQRFAAKWVEKTMIGFIALVLVAFAGALISLVIPTVKNEVPVASKERAQ